MSVLGNLLWIILGGGLLIFLAYAIGGVVLCVTIIGIPFGLQLFRIAAMSLSPFGKDVNAEGSLDGLVPLLMNLLWWIFGGIEVALVHLVFGLLSAITIVGLPFAKQHFKLLKLTLVPFGARIE